MVLHVIEHAKGGEIFVPKIPSYKILDLATAIAPDVPTQIVGLRPGEKIHEEMITSSDSPNTLDIGPYYVILQNGDGTRTKYLQENECTEVPVGFSYNSGANDQWLSIEEIRKMIVNHVDPHFEP